MNGRQTDRQRQGGDETENEEGGWGGKQKGKKKEMQNIMRIQLLDITEGTPRPMQTNKEVLTCKRQQPNCLCMAKTNKRQISYRNQCLQK